jgi:alanine racemase
MAHGHPTWAEIDLSAIGANIAKTRSLLGPGTRYCAVVKADGYGHGALAVAQEALNQGADYLAVAFLEEALALRDCGITAPLLILGITPPDLAALVAANELTQTVCGLEQAEALSLAGEALGRKVRAHLKIDTGMSRLGIFPEDAPAFAARLAGLPGLVLEGMFTHFATADSRDKTLSRRQLALFLKAREAVRSLGISIPLHHCANSAAILDLPETHLDMVRAGIIQYGLWPSEETGRPFALRPGMRLKTRIAMLRTVPPGTSAGYGAAFTATRETSIATLPLGYADGYARLLSGKALVAVNGQKAPLIGRICMDQCLADVTGLKGVREGAEVTIFGGEGIAAEDLASSMGTIAYEIVCMVGRRIPRVYRRD